MLGTIPQGSQGQAQPQDSPFPWSEFKVRSETREKKKYHPSAVYFQKLNSVHRNSLKSENSFLFSLTAKHQGLPFQKSIFFLMMPNVTQKNDHNSLGPLPNLGATRGAPSLPQHSAVSVTQWKCQGADVLSSEWQDGTSSSDGLSCVRCHEKCTKMSAHVGRMHLKYEIFPAGGYRQKFPFVPYQKGEEKWH